LAVKVLFNPILAFALFMAGMWLAAVDISFGLMSILGGLLFGFSSLRNDVKTMKKKTKLLFYGTFISFLSLFSITFMIMINLLT
jgi:amino acid permease